MRNDTHTHTHTHTHRGSYLGHVHAGVTAQWPDGSEVIGAQQGGDNSVLVHLPDHGGIDKVHEAILVYSNT